MSKKIKKTYETPTRGWQRERINRETDFLYEYGLKNKREVWKAESQVRDLRREARKLNASRDEQKEQELVEKLQRLSILGDGAELTDILDLTLTDILERRLQTIIYRKGLANTMNQARQLVNHGHIRIGDQVVSIPSYLATAEEEENINVAPGSKNVVQK